MFAFVFDSIGIGEWFVLLAVVLIVVGPRRLPSTARKFGQYYAKFRRAAESFKRQIVDMDSEFTSSIREAAEEIKSAAAEVENAANEAFQIPETVDEVQDFTSPQSLGIDYESGANEVKGEENVSISPPAAAESEADAEVKAEEEGAKSGD